MNRLGLQILAAVLTAAAWLRAEPPQLYTVEPDAEVLNGQKSMICPLRLIVGCNFDAPGLEVWSWPCPPAGDDAAILRQLPPTRESKAVRDAEEIEGIFAATPGEAKPDPRVLPATPPGDTAPVQPRKLTPVSVRSDTIIVAIEGGSIVWVRNRDGWSRPWLVGLAKPLWVSDRQVRAGDYLHLFGHSMALEYLKARVALRSPQHTVLVNTTGSPRESGWYSDRFLEYLRVPADTPPGTYDLFAHNSRGGLYGWVYAGELAVLPQAQPERPVISARAHGAKGDGMTDDSPALYAAVAAAYKAGADLHLPVGTYALSRTLGVPPGVTLRGNAGALTAFKPAVGAAVGGSLVSLGSDSGLLHLSLAGFSGGALLELRPHAAGIRILGCTIATPAATGAAAPREAIIGEANTDVRIGSCTVTGNVHFTRANHLEVVKTQFTGDLALAGVNCLVDANRFDPGRLLLGALSRSLVRFNEVHAPPGPAPTDPLTAPELLVNRTVGTATGGTAATLQDTTRRWSRDALQDDGVLILAGTGTGQYRLISGNSADTLTVDPPWAVPPDASSRYLAGPMSLDTAFNFNYFDIPEPWPIVNSVGCVIQYHRSSRGGIAFRGIDRRTAAPEGAAALFPCWFNRLNSSWLNQAGVTLTETRSAQVPAPWPLTLGNAVAGCVIQNPAPAPCVSVSGACNLVCGNGLLVNPVGLAVAVGAANTVLQGNVLRFITTPVADAGTGTVNSGNQLFDEVLEEPLTDVLTLSQSRWRPTTLQWTSPWFGTKIPGRPLGVPPYHAGPPPAAP